MILAIYGAGGAGKSLLEIAKNINKEKKWEEIIFVDDVLEAVKCKDIAVFTFDALLEKFDKSNIEIAISLGEPRARRMLADKVKKSGIKLANIIHESVYVYETAKIGQGVVLLNGTIVGDNVEIGDNVFCEEYVVISHDCRIGSNTFCAAKVSMAGNCDINESVFIGMHATIREHVHVAKNAIIGMASVVIHDVEENTTVVGSPAKILERTSHRGVFRQ